MWEGPLAPGRWKFSERPEILPHLPGAISAAGTKQSGRDGGLQPFNSVTGEILPRGKIPPQTPRDSVLDVGGDCRAQVWSGWNVSLLGFQASAGELSVAEAATGAGPPPGSAARDLGTASLPDAAEWRPRNGANVATPPYLLPGRVRGHVGLPAH